MAMLLSYNENKTIHRNKSTALEWVVAVIELLRKEGNHCREMKEMNLNSKTLAHNCFYIFTLGR